MTPAQTAAEAVALIPELLQGYAKSALREEDVQNAYEVMNSATQLLRPIAEGTHCIVPVKSLQYIKDERTIVSEVERIDNAEHGWRPWP